MVITMSAIEIKNLSKFYKKDFWSKKNPAVMGLSFSIKEGVVTGFVGPNGAGKTTTIKMMMGLVKPSAGSISLGGIDSSKSVSRKNVAYLSEQPYFYGHLSVQETLRFSANLLKISSRKISSEIEKVLFLVELTGKENIKVKNLSKGMQQRLNMAQTLLGDPHTLILDEPMSGMDPPGRRLFRNLFNELASKGKTIFFSTHVLEDIESVCSEVVVLSKGRLSYCGKVSSLLANGFSGTDLLVGKLIEEEIQTLRESECVVSEPQKGKWKIFIPAEKDVLQIQKYLASHDKFCESITGRSMRLEDLLYKNKDGSRV